MVCLILLVTGQARIHSRQEGVSWSLLESFGEAGVREQLNKDSSRVYRPSSPRTVLPTPAKTEETHKDIGPAGEPTWNAAVWTNSVSALLSI